MLNAGHQTIVASLNQGVPHMLILAKFTRSIVANVDILSTALQHLTNVTISDVPTVRVTCGLARSRILRGNSTVLRHLSHLC